MNNFRVLVRESSHLLFPVALRMLGDREAANDAIQETMISAWEKIAALKSVESYKSWIYRILINKCYDQLRARKKREEINADEVAWKKISDRLSADGSPVLEENETVLVIKKLTGKLSPRQKTVFILTDLEEMDADEISAITGMSKVNVKANLHYARKNIGEMIKKYL